VTASPEKKKKRRGRVSRFMEREQRDRSRAAEGTSTHIRDRRHHRRCQRGEGLGKAAFEKRRRQQKRVGNGHAGAADKKNSKSSGSGEESCSNRPPAEMRFQTGKRKGPNFDGVRPRGRQTNWKPVNPRGRKWRKLLRGNNEKKSSSRNCSRSVIADSSEGYRFEGRGGGRVSPGLSSKKDCRV